ncbi:MAG: PAS domain-containing protein [Rhizomicrobium sp.]
MTDFDTEFDPAIHEPQALAFIRDYWEMQRGAAAMPRRRDVAPNDMKAYLPHILLADVVQNGKDFRYRLVGSELQRYFSGNPTGVLMSSALTAFGQDTVERTIAVYRQVTTRRKPLRIRGAGMIYSQDAKTFDALLTPLSDDGENANMILGTFVFEWALNARAILTPIVEPDDRALEKALTLSH